MTSVGAWNEVDTARMYERFCRHHRRYRVANEALAAHAALAPGLRVLDVAAGTGRTAEVCLPRLGVDGTVLCVEPADAMRSVGARRLRDSRLSWTSTLPDESASFDRIVCGAAIWQLLPLDATIGRLSRMLSRGGALVFNMPAQYLLEPDRPGGGRDPFLAELPTFIERSAKANEQMHMPREASISATDRSTCTAADVSQLLAVNGLNVEQWTFDVRFTQAAYRDWLKIPPTSESMLTGLSIEDRARRIDQAYTLVDARSWRWERWLGWTAWRSR